MRAHGDHFCPSEYGHISKITQWYFLLEFLLLPGIWFSSLVFVKFWRFCPHLPNTSCAAQIRLTCALLTSPPRVFTVLHVSLVQACFSLGNDSNLLNILLTWRGHFLHFLAISGSVCLACAMISKPVSFVDWVNQPSKSAHQLLTPLHKHDNHLSPSFVSAGTESFSCTANGVITTISAADCAWSLAAEGSFSSPELL